MRIENVSLCLGGVLFVLCSFFSLGCVLTGDEQDGAFGPMLPGDLYNMRPGPWDERPLPGWHPRTHPPGSLLMDHSGDYWMADNWLERVPVSGDALEQAGISEASAIRMTRTEETCLVAVEPYWWGRAVGDDWLPTLGPDGGTWFVEYDFAMKRRADAETLRSWGYGERLTPFNGTDEAWRVFREVEPLPYRDGYMLRTEIGISYFVRGERWLFASEMLAREAGYDVEDIQAVDEAQLADHPLVGTFTREAFGICPAETPLGEMTDRDGDGSTTERDCDDDDPAVGEGFPERCDGLDNDCNGITDDPFPIDTPCLFTYFDCRLEGVQICTPDGEATVCDADPLMCEC